MYYNNRNGRIVLSGDAAKYMNHSDNPNCDTLLWTSEEDMKRLVFIKACCLFVNY